MNRAAIFGEHIGEYRGLGKLGDPRNGELLGSMNAFRGPTTTVTPCLFFVRTLDHLHLSVPSQLPAPVSPPECPARFKMAMPMTAPTFGQSSVYRQGSSSTSIVHSPPYPVISTRRACFCSGAGIFTSSTPSRNVAETFSALTPCGSGTQR